MQSSLLPDGVQLCERPIATLMRNKSIEVGNDGSHLKPASSTSVRPPWWNIKWRPYLRSTATGSQWPQARLAAAFDSIDDPRCQLCGHEHGTCAHRVKCPANIPSGGWPEPSKAATAGLKRFGARQNTMLDAHGLAVLSMRIPKPPQQHTLVWLIELDTAADPDQVTWYVDGSLIDPNTPFARLGAGIVGVGPDHTPCALAYGTPPPLG